MKTQTNHLWVTLVMMALLYAATTATTTADAQVRPLPPLSFDSLSQTYHGRLTTTLHRLFVRKDELRHYVTKDEAANHVTTSTLASELSRYVTKDEAANHVTTSDSRLSDARTPKGAAGGDLVGSYPNPTIKSSVSLSGSPTTTTPSSTDNSTRIATTAYVQANRYTHPAYTSRTGNTGNMAPSFGGTAYTYTYNVDNIGHVTGVNTRTITIPNTTATTSSAGLMSASDKSNLNKLTDAPKMIACGILTDISYSPPGFKSYLGNMKMSGYVRNTTTNKGGHATFTFDNPDNKQVFFVVTNINCDPGYIQSYSLTSAIIYFGGNHYGGERLQIMVFSL